MRTTVRLTRLSDQWFHSHINISTSSRSYSLEHICDYLRCHLARVAAECPVGQYTSVHITLDWLLISCYLITSSIHLCANDHPVDKCKHSMPTCEIMIIDPPPGCTIQECINDFTVVSVQNADVHWFKDSPLQTICSFDHILNIHVDGLAVHYWLRGVIYSTGDHFMAHFIMQVQWNIHWMHVGLWVTGPNINANSRCDLHYLHL